MEQFLPIIRENEDKSCPLKNRIRKNYKHVRKWAQRTQTNAFRIYDKDIKQYPLAIDFYNGKFLVHYFTNEDQELAPRQEFYDRVMDALTKLLAVQPDDVFWKARIKRAEKQQYSKLEETGQFFEVLEHGTKFMVNLVDYLDTGLFLDHRETRRLVAQACKGKSLLNLFSYTGSFSVQAAMQGASYTKSVDMSNMYTDWTRQNFLINGLSLKNNDIVRADCLQFLQQEVEEKKRYDVIVIDPPTISRSKKMEQFFDVQEDYVFLITKALQLLSSQGVIFFSTNSKKFRFDPERFSAVSIMDISKKTIPIDFHDSKVHRCWQLIPI